MSDTYLGMDLGATKLLVGEMDRGGTVLWEKRYDTGVLTQKNAFALMKSAMEDILAERDIKNVRGLGIGMPGKVDNARGIWHEVDITRHDPIALAGEMEKRYGLPCFIDNDVRSALRAEMLYGTGREADSFVLLNIGTGIASSAVIGGQILTGSHFEAGEIGHTASGFSLGIPCFCGRKDCVESIASGGGIAARARALSAQHPGFPTRATDIFARYGQDPDCTRLTDDAVKAAANLMMNMMRFYDPQCVVLTGSVALNAFFFNRLLEAMPETYRDYMPMGIRQSALKPGSLGLMGACCNVICGLK